MNRAELVKRRGADWQRLEGLLDRSRRAAAVGLEPAEVSELSTLYRGLAGDLMRVRRDRLGADLERHLDLLASRAHNTLYAGTGVGQRFRFAELIFDFPGAVRRASPFFFLSFVLFFGPLFLSGILAYLDESYALAVLDGEQLEGVEKMYREASADGRNVNTDTAMTGFYVYNNVGIALRCFGTGLLFAVGSIYVVFTNGLFIGTVFGHLARVGLGEKIFSFVSSHSPWELTAIVIAGAAGIQMGYALVKTNGRTRFGNLRAISLELLRQVVGSAAFLLFAALIEGNVSPSALPNETKYAFGAIGWAMVAVILAFAGRERPVPSDVVDHRAGRAS